MVKQCNKNLYFTNYNVDDKVWLHKKHFKKGENPKLSPRKSGPWRIVKVYPNKVNFKIEDSEGNQQVVHHNKLSPMKEAKVVESDCSSDEGEPGLSGAEEENIEPLPLPQPAGVDEPIVRNPTPFETRYPARERRQREQPGTVSWDSVSLDGD